MFSALLFVNGVDPIGISGSYVTCTTPTRRMSGRGRQPRIRASGAGTTNVAGASTTGRVLYCIVTFSSIAKGLKMTYDSCLLALNLALKDFSFIAGVCLVDRDGRAARGGSDVSSPTATGRVDLQCGRVSEGFTL